MQDITTALVVWELLQALQVPWTQMLPEVPRRNNQK